MNWITRVLVLIFAGVFLSSGSSQSDETTVVYSDSSTSETSDLMTSFFSSEPIAMTSIAANNNNDKSSTSNYDSDLSKSSTPLSEGTQTTSDELSSKTVTETNLNQNSSKTTFEVEKTSSVPSNPNKDVDTTTEIKNPEFTSTTEVAKDPSQTGKLALEKMSSDTHLLYSVTDTHITATDYTTPSFKREDTSSETGTKTYDLKSNNSSEKTDTSPMETATLKLNQTDSAVTDSSENPNDQIQYTLTNTSTDERATTSTLKPESSKEHSEDENRNSESSGRSVTKAALESDSKESSTELNREIMSATSESSEVTRQEIQSIDENTHESVITDSTAFENYISTEPSAAISDETVSSPRSVKRRSVDSTDVFPSAFSTLPTTNQSTDESVDEKYNAFIVSQTLKAADKFLSNLRSQDMDVNNASDYIPGTSVNKTELLDNKYSSENNEYSVSQSQQSEMITVFPNNIVIPQESTENQNNAKSLIQNHVVTEVQDLRPSTYEDHQLLVSSSVSPVDKSNATTSIYLPSKDQINKPLMNNINVSPSDYLQTVTTSGSIFSTGIVQPTVNMKSTLNLNTVENSSVDLNNSNSLLLNDAKFHIDNTTDIHKIDDNSNVKNIQQLKDGTRKSVVEDQMLSDAAGNSASTENHTIQVNTIIIPPNVNTQSMSFTEIEKKKVVDSTVEFSDLKPSAESFTNINKKEDLTAQFSTDENLNGTSSTLISTKSAVPKDSITHPPENFVNSTDQLQKDQPGARSEKTSYDLSAIFPLRLLNDDMILNTSYLQDSAENSNNISNSNSIKHSSVTEHPLNLKVKLTSLHETAEKSTDHLHLLKVKTINQAENKELSHANSVNTTLETMIIDEDIENKSLQSNEKLKTIVKPTNDNSQNFSEPKIELKNSITAINITNENTSDSTNETTKRSSIVPVLNIGKDFSPTNDTTNSTHVSSTVSTEPSTTTKHSFRVRIPGALGNRPTRAPFIKTTTKRVPTVKGPPVSIFSKNRTRSGSITSSTAPSTTTRYTRAPRIYAPKRPDFPMANFTFPSVPVTTPEVTTEDYVYEGEEEEETPDEITDSVADDTETVLLQFGASMVVEKGLRWVEQLYNRHSPEYAKQSRRIHFMLDRLFRGTALAPVYWKVEIDGFSETYPGSRSVIVDYMLHLVQSDENVDTARLVKIFNDCLMNNTYSRYRLNPNKTEFEFVQRLKPNKPTEPSEMEPPIPQWAIAVIVIGAASLIFIILFGAVTVYGRHHMRRRYASKLSDEDFERSIDSREWESKMGAAYENLAADGVYDCDEGRADNMKKRYFPTAHIRNSSVKHFDSWRTEWTEQPKRVRTPIHRVAF